MRTLPRRIAVTPREAKDVEWAIDGMASSLHATPEEIDYAPGDLPRLEAGVLVLGSSRGAEEDLRYRLVEQLRDMTIEEGGAEQALPRARGWTLPLEQLRPAAARWGARPGQEAGACPVLGGSGGSGPVAARGGVVRRGCRVPGDAAGVLAGAGAGGCAVSAGHCRNATEILSPHRGRMMICPCSGNADGACACTPTSTYGMARGADRNLCGCWPEPVAPRAPRLTCRCGAGLTHHERRAGLQCPACTRRDESLYGSGCGL